MRCMAGNFNMKHAVTSDFMHHFFLTSMKSVSDVLLGSLKEATDKNTHLILFRSVPSSAIPKGLTPSFSKLSHSQSDPELLMSMRLSLIVGSVFTLPVKTREAALHSCKMSLLKQFAMLPASTIK
mmetsp:Transcript_15982/g.23385  ORF Transcript_15982/g.23385 Transcript_15982/m.23385 type:complete len:125 (-) Transcript_15982:259-633(-)